MTADEAVLLEILHARSFKRGEFTLSSGKRSRIYFNMKTTMLDPLGAELCARLLIAKLAGLEADYVAGLEMGAVPLLGSVAAASHKSGRPLPALFVRKSAKAYGSLALLEGLDDHAGETLLGKHVVLIDDVATTGNALVKAMDPIRAAGGIVSDAIVLLDREEGAGERLRRDGIALHALFTATDLGVTDADRAPFH